MSTAQKCQGFVCSYTRTVWVYCMRTPLRALKLWGLLKKGKAPLVGMSFLFARRSQHEKSVALDSPGGGLGLASLSCNSANANSPGKLRILKSRKATRNSPYGKKRGGSRLGLSSFDSSSWGDDGSSLLDAGQAVSNAWVADKHIGIKVGGAGGPSHGLKLITDPVHGVIVSGIDRAGQAAQNGLLVLDIV